MTFWAGCFLFFPAACCVSVVLTPSNEKEDPLSKLVRGIGHYNGCVKVASFNKHPEKVSHHKVVVNGRNKPTPRLQERMVVQRQSKTKAIIL